MRERQPEQTADIPQQEPEPVKSGTPGGYQIDPNTQGTDAEERENQHETPSRFDA